MVADLEERRTVPAASAGTPGIHGCVDDDAPPGAAAFADVVATTIVAEAGLITGRMRPAYGEDNRTDGSPEESS